jgi:hypothetical protein
MGVKRHLHRSAGTQFSIPSFQIPLRSDSIMVSSTRLTVITVILAISASGTPLFQDAEASTSIILPSQRNANPAEMQVHVLSDEILKPNLCMCS